MRNANCGMSERGLPGMKRDWALHWPEWLSSPLSLLRVHPAWGNAGISESVGRRDRSERPRTLKNHESGSSVLRCERMDHGRGPKLLPYLTRASFHLRKKGNVVIYQDLPRGSQWRSISSVGAFIDDPRCRFAAAEGVSQLKLTSAHLPTWW